MQIYFFTEFLFSKTVLSVIFYKNGAKSIHDPDKMPKCHPVLSFLCLVYKKADRYIDNSLALMYN